MIAFDQVQAILDSMNSKQRKTLDAIFAKPTLTNLEWDHMESLLITVGCKVIEGNATRVRFVLGEAVTTFHRQHPAKEAKKYQVDDARVFLATIRVTP